MPMIYPTFCSVRFLPHLSILKKSGKSQGISGKYQGIQKLVLVKVSPNADKTIIYADFINQ